MIKLFFLNLWSNIRRSPLVSCVIFIQLVLTSFFLFYAIYTNTDLQINNSYVQNAYGTNKLFYTMYNTQISVEEMMRNTGDSFVSLEETDYSDYETFKKLVDEAQFFDAAIQSRTMLYTNYPLSEWGITDQSAGEYSFLYNERDDGYYRPNAWSIDQEYLEIFGIRLDSGRLFTEEDFENFDPNRVPVLLGYDYKQYFSIGDTFQANMFALPSPTRELMTFEVIGFIKEDQFVYDLGGGGDPLPLDTYIVVPYFEKTLEEWAEFKENNPDYAPMSALVRYYLLDIGLGPYSSKQYVATPENESAAYAEMEEILRQSGLDNFYRIAKIHKTEQMADNYAEKTQTELYLMIIMLCLSLASVIFTSINNISDNVKTYAIHNLVGASRRKIVAYSVLETFVYCFVGFIAGYLWFEMLFNVRDFHNEPAYLPSMKTSLTVACLFVALSCLFAYIFVNIKLRGYSISSLIRGNEVRKGRGFSLYKIITFVMLLFVSICVTFVTSYNWLNDHIDKYQHDFFSTNAYWITLNSLSQQDPPTIELEYDIEEVDNYIIDKLDRLNYDSSLGPCIRGTYFKGDVELPEMTWGRYFTQEEVKQESNYVVVGKNVLEDFTEEKDGKRIYVYNNKEYEVIGVMGREGHDTSVDNWAFFTLPTLMNIYGAKGSYTIDAPTLEEAEKVLEIIEEQVAPISSYYSNPVNTDTDIGITTYILNLFIALIALTAAVFGIYYIDKITKTINVKKFVGYSGLMIFADTAVQFITISLLAYTIGNSLMWLLSKTLLQDLLLLSAFKINLPILAFSFAAILLLAFILSIFAIIRSFNGSSRDLKRE